MDLVKNVLSILKQVFPKMTVKEGRENFDRNLLQDQITTALKIIPQETTNYSNKNNLKGASADVVSISPCQCQAIKNICKMFGIK